MVTLRFSYDDASGVPDALAQTGREFFLPDDSPSGTGPALDEDSFSSGSDLEYRHTHALSAMLELSRRYGFGSHGYHGWSVGVGVGHNRFRLPAGISVFVDPATVKFRHVVIEASYALGIQLRSGAFGLWGAQFETGLRATRIKTTIRSAVFDVTSYESIVAGFGGFAILKPLPKRGATLFARVRLYERGVGGASAGLALSF